MADRHTFLPSKTKWAEFQLALTEPGFFDAFDSRRQDRNRFLQQDALPIQSSGASPTYVGLADHTVIGYYSLAVGSVEYEQAPARVTKGLAH